MISQEDQNKQIEYAWEKLHQRLSQDGLLSKRATKKSMLQKSIMKWAAAIIVLIICFTIVFISTPPTDTTLLALHNKKGEPALATTLEDGSIVLLDEKTSLYYPACFAKDKREVKIQGKALFDISANALKPFIINTNLVTVEVVGTTFKIECNNNTSFFLSVKNGEVKATLKENGQVVYIKAGESVSLSHSNLQKVASSFSSHTSNIQFKDELLINVAKAINLLSDSAKLSISPNIANRRITITMANNSIYTFAELICSALDLSLSQKDSTISISSKN